MSIQIKSRYGGKVLYTAENAKDVREALEEAVASGAYLRGAYLGGADLGDAYLGDANLGGADLGDAYLGDANLRGAYLRGAYLGGADLGDAYLGGADLGDAYLGDAYLGDANLRDAYLRDANLRDAYLRDAYLRDAYLGGADLRGADLRGAYLRDAYLGGADLRGADLRGAYLRDAYLGGAKGFKPELVNDLLMLHDQPGPIRAYKLVNEDSEGIYNGGLTYEIGKTLEVEDADTDPMNDCGAGINLATLPWCLREWHEGCRVLICEFTAKDIAAIPTSDGKFRVTRCEVVGEKDIGGLVE